MSIDIYKKIKDECTTLIECFMSDLNERLDVKSSYETKGAKLMLNEYIADLISKSDKSKRINEFNKMIKEHNKTVKALNIVIMKRRILIDANVILLVNGEPAQEKADPETQELQLKAYDTQIAIMRTQVEESNKKMDLLKKEIGAMVA
jgi:hypothetical protein